MQSGFTPVVFEIDLAAQTLVGCYRDVIDIDFSIG